MPWMYEDFSIKPFLYGKFPQSLLTSGEVGCIDSIYIRLLDASLKKLK